MNERNRLCFDRGTLVLHHRDGQNAEFAGDAKQWKWDDRIDAWRAPAVAYRRILTQLHRSQIPYDDEARAYQELSLNLETSRIPHPHQKEGLEAWHRGGRRGIVILPTGAGKSYLAELAIRDTGRSTLVIAPTIDLMNQWYDLLTTSFSRPVGIVGGGYNEIHDLTVTTYDSAYIHMDRMGNRFALLVFDECHHLPGPSYMHAAESSIAPFRLGLTATLERADEGEKRLEPVLGPVNYEKSIRELSGRYLAEYEVVRHAVELSPELLERYHTCRGEYQAFTRRMGIRMSSPTGFQQFVMMSSRSKSGRSAFKAYRESKRIALTAPAKIHLLEQLLRRHRRDRVIIFTHENEMVYEISKRFLIPALTHRTDTKERKALLENFRAGKVPALATSKVLNEGVDLPTASVGIVLSGSGSIREHVQRLGRILRRKEGKEAVLYEIIAKGTVEEYVSARRREHDAYRGGA